MITRVLKTETIIWYYCFFSHFFKFCYRPAAVVWYGSLLVILVFTAKGRNARLFCWSRTCNRRVNDQIVDRMMEPQQAETSQTLAWRRRLWWAQLRSSTGADQAPNELALKTKVFRAARKESNGDEEQTCAICFNPLQGGERFGD